ncbi:potassium channel family protein [Ethanoligenens harbinense]|uniref:Trk system potassium uptake protein TrkA n=1 Tax=Ethanoligenens harbinense (strain DSM 18485 / JCM 12961 / CGMCC 1.5033 / YUAN-3) TaxID=663278 RepID=E6U6T8_ETHHY|nr:NAD-binding protein [Ethanoligenens harbinense]ADU26905.1 TrkA-N domain protein [Ethanoligenens harbinense YUAN-3]AVQ96000.1 potassium transporter TrkA [Ethanoligenens harbinense YUAN-3]AYF38662.1 potassium transporter TrkA [Ethanoligenens harbinense]AYF41409.1 potassium transporter TrkA [Ethanoligenens harbinense]QCN92243.1 TrkA family potassium uptake protein [Ethanoligenens harbinense]
MKILIVGGGQVGSYLATLLSANDHAVTVVEQREPIVERLRKELPNVSFLLGGGSHPQVLEDAGIASADVVVAVTGRDETNLVVSTLAKMEYGVSRVVARVNNPKNKWLFTPAMGVDAGVNQADLLAHLILEEMNLKAISTLLKINRGDYSIIQIEVDAHAASVGKKLKDLAIPKQALLIAVTRNEQTYLPKGDTTILEGDSILALADSGSRAQLQSIFGA